MKATHDCTWREYEKANKILFIDFTSKNATKNNFLESPFLTYINKSHYRPMLKNACAGAAPNGYCLGTKIP